MAQPLFGKVKKPNWPPPSPTDTQKYADWVDQAADYFLENALSLKPKGKAPAPEADSEITDLIDTYKAQLAKLYPTEKEKADRIAQAKKGGSPSSTSTPSPAVKAGGSKASELSAAKIESLTQAVQKLLGNGVESILSKDSVESIAKALSSKPSSPAKKYGGYYNDYDDSSYYTVESELQTKFSNLNASDRKQALARLKELPNKLGTLYIRSMLWEPEGVLELTSRLNGEGSKKGLDLLNKIARNLESFMDRKASGSSYYDDGYYGSAFYPKSSSYYDDDETTTADAAKIGHCPFLAELFLSLNHPMVKNGEGDIDTMTSGISSIERFINDSVRVKQYMISEWARVGVLTHAFRLWKYDAMGGPNSLLVKFGFKLLPGDHKSNPFEAGYYINTSAHPELDAEPNTTVVFKRGYLLITNPKYGSILIRNSSFVFGRNLLPEPAYYSPKVLDYSKLSTIRDEQDLKDQDFIRLTDRSLHSYKEDVKTYKNVKALLDNLAGVKDQYANWKLDPTGFNADETFNGDKTEGLQAIYQHLSDLLADREMGLSEKPLPRLALYSRKLPPDQPYKFADAEGIEHESLVVDNTLLDEIRDRMNGDWSEAKYPNSLWKEFVQAAVDHNAELVLIDPKK